MYTHTGVYPTGTGPVSVSAWFKLASAPSLAPAGGASPIGIGSNSTNGRFVAFVTNTLIGGDFSGPVTQGLWTWNTNWHYLVMVYPSTATSVANTIVYLDGAPVTIIVMGAGALAVIPPNIQVGANAADNGDFNFPGLIDETRVAGEVSASQVTADFNSQQAGSTFLTVGTEVHI